MLRPYVLNLEKCIPKFYFRKWKWYTSMQCPTLYQLERLTCQLSNLTCFVVGLGAVCSACRIRIEDDVEVFTEALTSPFCSLSIQHIADQHSPWVIRWSITWRYAVQIRKDGRITILVLSKNHLTGNWTAIKRNVLGLGTRPGSDHYFYLHYGRSRGHYIFSSV